MVTDSRLLALIDDLREGGESATVESWERTVARQFVAADGVVELLNEPSYYVRVDRPVPTNRDLLLEDLAEERLIAGMSVDDGTSSTWERSCLPWTSAPLNQA